MVPAVALTDMTEPVTGSIWTPFGNSLSTAARMYFGENMGPPQMAPSAGHDGAANSTSALLVDPGGCSAAKTAPASPPNRAMRPIRTLYRPMIWTNLDRPDVCWLIWPPRDLRRPTSVVSDRHHDTTGPGNGHGFVC